MNTAMQNTDPYLIFIGLYDSIMFKTQEQNCVQTY